MKVKPDLRLPAFDILSVYYRDALDIRHTRLFSYSADIVSYVLEGFKLVTITSNRATCCSSPLVAKEQAKVL